MPELLPLSQCPACHSRRTVPVRSGRRGIDIVRCVGCRLLRPSAALPGEHVERELPPVAALIDGYARALPDVFHVKAGARLLDVACGSGAFLDAAQERGFVTHGLEWGSAAREAEEHHRVHVRRPDLARDPPDSEPGGAFEVISFVDVLTRLADPVGWLRWARAHLAPGGAVVVDVPDATRFTARSAPSAGGWDDGTRQLFVEPKSLKGLAARAGLRVTDAWSGPLTALVLARHTGVLLGSRPLAEFLTPPEKLARTGLDLADSLVRRSRRAPFVGPRLVASLVAD